MTDSLRSLVRRRWRIAITLTVLMVIIYFGFILLIAFNKPLVGATIVPGVSLGIALGALVIAAAWILTYCYVRWANRTYDPGLLALKRREEPR